jgi:cytochrome c-type biogenesis protein CcmE
MTSSKLVKIIVSVLVVGGGLGYLLYSTAGSAFEYYKHVDEVTGARASWQGKPMQLHGFVVPGSIQKRFDKDHGRLEYRFRETNCGQDLDVYYAGVVPDTFKDGAEVVVKGTLEGDSFHSTEVMAKCPSKYQATAAQSSMCTRGKAN